MLTTLSALPELELYLRPSRQLLTQGAGLYLVVCAGAFYIDLGTWYVLSVGTLCLWMFFQRLSGRCNAVSSGSIAAISHRDGLWRVTYSDGQSHSFNSCRIANLMGCLRIEWSNLEEAGIWSSRLGAREALLLAPDSMSPEMYRKLNAFIKLPAR